MANSEIEAYSGSSEILRREEPLAPVVALEAYEEEIRHPKKWIGREFDMVSTRGFYLPAVLGGLGLSVAAGFLTMDYTFLGPPIGLFAGVVTTGILGIGTMIRSAGKTEKAEKAYLEKLAAVALVGDRLTEEVEGWLMETYGLKFASEFGRIHLRDRVLGIRPLGWHDLPFKSAPPIEPPKPGLLATVSLAASSGSRVEGDFYLTEDGGFELRKHTILDTTESPYFTPIREELS